jgi:hypothetical protein
MEQKEIARLLRLLADLIERSSPGDVDALLGGRAILHIEGSERRGHGPAKRPAPAHRDMKEIVNLLQTLESRDEGLALLRDLTKKELEIAARIMDLPVIRDDDSERLMQKLVESSIGARLNSRAIRG